MATTITVDAKQLKAAVRECEGAHARSTQIRGILLQANGKLVVRGADLEYLSARFELPTEEGEGGPAWQTYADLAALGPQGEWQAYVSGAALAALLPASGTVRLTPEGKGLSVALGGGKRAQIGGLDARDFNYLPEVIGDTGYDGPRLTGRNMTGALSFTEAELHRLLSVVFAASGDESRPVLCSVLLQCEGGQVTATATDTHRLVRAWGEAHVTGSVPNVVVAASAVREVLGHLRKDSEEACAVVFAGGGVCTIILRAGQYALTTRPIEGQFPDYRKVIPSASEWGVRVNAKRLKEALDAVAPVALHDANRVSVEVGEESVTLRASNEEGGRAVAVLSCKTHGQRPAERLGVNGRMLAQYLAGKAGNVVVEGTGPLNAFAIREVNDECPDGEVGCVQMPMQTEEAMDAAVAVAQAEREAALAAARAKAEASAAEEAAQEGSPAPEVVAEYNEDRAKDPEEEGEPIERDRPIRYAVVQNGERAWVHFGPNLPVTPAELAQIDADEQRTFLPFHQCRKVARDLHDHFGVAVVVDVDEPETNPNGAEYGAAPQMPYELPEVCPAIDLRGADYASYHAFELALVASVKAAEESHG